MALFRCGSSSSGGGGGQVVFSDRKTGTQTLSILTSGKKYAAYVAYGWSNTNYGSPSIGGDITVDQTLHTDSVAQNVTGQSVGYFNSITVEFTATGTNLTVTLPPSTANWTGLVVQLD